MVASIQPFTPTRHADQVFKLLDEIHERHFEGIRNAQYDIANDAEHYMRRRLTTGPRTGRLYRFRGRIHQASAGGEFPARLTGALSRGIRSIVRPGVDLEVGSSIGERYPSYLEFGTRKMLRRPFIEPTSNNFANRFAILLTHFSRTALSKGRGRRI